MQNSSLVRIWHAGFSVIRQVWKHRELTLTMAKRDFLDRYAGQVFGMYWGIAHPLLILSVFVFLFGVIFKAKVGGTVSVPFGYTVYLFSGMIPWLCFQEVMNKASLAITANANLVKQVIFPLEVLPVKIVLGSLPGHMVSIGFMTVYAAVAYRFLPWTYVLLPVLVLVEILFAVGVAFFLASFGVFFRDTKDLIQFFTFIGVYLSPIVFLIEWVPGSFRLIIYANPLSHMIWCFQDICYYGRFLHPISWLVFFGTAFLVFFLGARTFVSLKSHFGNHL
jgi:lipopolysaccharide transport system permease protein